MSALVLFALLAAEPLVVTPMADPDPAFVAPKVSKARRARRVPARAAASSPRQGGSLEEALLDLDAAVEEAKASARQQELQGEDDLRAAEDAVRKAQEQVAEAERAAAAAPPVEAGPQH